MLKLLVPGTIFTIMFALGVGLRGDAFGLDKIIGAIEHAGGRPHAQTGVRLVAVGFVVTGVLALILATLQHERDLRWIHSSEFVYRRKPSIATATAVVIAAIGVLALALLLAGTLFR